MQEYKLSPFHILSVVIGVLLISTGLYIVIKHEKTTLIYISSLLISFGLTVILSTLVGPVVAHIRNKSLGFTLGGPSALASTLYVVLVYGDYIFPISLETKLKKDFSDSPNAVREAIRKFWIDDPNSQDSKFFLKANELESFLSAGFNNQNIEKDKELEYQSNYASGILSWYTRLEQGDKKNLLNVDAMIEAVKLLEWSNIEKIKSKEFINKVFDGPVQIVPDHFESKSIEWLKNNSDSETIHIENDFKTIADFLIDHATGNDWVILENAKAVIYEKLKGYEFENVSFIIGADDADEIPSDDSDLTIVRIHKNNRLIDNTESKKLIDVLGQSRKDGREVKSFLKIEQSNDEFPIKIEITRGGSNINDRLGMSFKKLKKFANYDRLFHTNSVDREISTKDLNERPFVCNIIIRIE